MKKFIIDNGVSVLYVRYTHYANPIFNSFLYDISVLGIKVVIEIPTYPYDYEYNQAGFLSRSKLFLEQCFRRKMAKFIHKIVTFSPDSEIWGRETICISNAIDPMLLPLSAAKFNGKQLNFIAVANLASWHGYDRIIRSICKYYETCLTPAVDVHLHLVGGGTLLPELKQLATELGVLSRVTFHGALDGNKLDEVFAISHIGVDSLGRHRSGNNYNNSLKSKEYLARGLPIIKSHVDISIDNELCCYQIPVDDGAFSIQDICDWFIKSEFSADEIRMYAISRFSWDEQMKLIINAIK